MEDVGLQDTELPLSLRVEMAQQASLLVDVVLVVSPPLDMEQAVADRR